LAILASCARSEPLFVTSCAFLHNQTRSGTREFIDNSHLKSSVERSAQRRLAGSILSKVSKSSVYESSKFSLVARISLGEDLL